MIREGKRDGWLTLPIDALQPWALLHGVQLNATRFLPSDPGGVKGAGLYASAPAIAADEHDTPLLTVPRDLILSKERVELHAKVDSDLRAVLDSLGEFGKVSLKFMPADKTRAEQL